MEIAQTLSWQSRLRGILGGLGAQVSEATVVRV